MLPRIMDQAIRLFVLLSSLVIFADSTAWSQSSPDSADQQPADADLSLTQVTLYSCGMGWFVYEGEVAEDSRYSLEIRESEISDVMRTLNVTDSGGDVSVHLESGADPIRRSPSLPETQTLGDLLVSMKGEPVRIRTRLKSELEGRLVSVELRPEIVDDSVVDREVLTVLTDDGLQRIALADVAELSAERDPFRDLLSKALDRYQPENEEPRRELQIEFAKAQPRQVAVALLRPVPMWKSTYRMHEGVFQHRAIVENTTDDDWQDISLALVDGSPVTFRVDLDRIARARRPQVARPVSRPEVPAPIAESLAPPEAPAVGEGADQAMMMQGGGMGGMGGAMGGGMGGMGGGMGGGDAFGSMESRRRPEARPGDEPSTPRDRRFAIDQSATGARAAAGSAGQAMQVTFPQVTVPAGQAVLLDAQPFEVRTDVVSVYRSSAEERAPLLSLELENQSNMRLPAGPLSVFLDRTGYAGDAMLPLLSPGVERLVGFAIDDGVRVTPRPTRRRTERSKLVVQPSTRTIRVTHVETKTETFLVDNRSGTERQVLIDHEGPDSGFQWSEERPDGERTEDGWRFSMEIPHGERQTLELTTQRSEVTGHPFASVDLDLVHRWLQQEGLVEGEPRESLTDLVSQRVKQAEIVRRLNERQQERKEVLAEIERVTRQLTGRNTALSETLSDRYQKRLLELEDELEALDPKITELEEQTEALEDQLQSPQSESRTGGSDELERNRPAAGRRPAASDDPFGDDDPFGGDDPFGR